MRGILLSVRGRWKGSSINITTYAKSEQGSKCLAPILAVNTSDIRRMKPENKKFELRVKFNPVGCSADGVVHGISLFLKLPQ